MAKVKVSGPLSGVNGARAGDEKFSFAMTVGW